MRQHGRERLRTLRLVDVDVGGDLHRVVLGGVSPCPGESVRERMNYLEQRADGLRRLLISQPFGNERMCVDLVMPAILPEAALGFVIMEVMGYPYYSGSNTIATTAAVLEAGLIPMTEGLQSVCLETPGGLVRVTAENRDGRVLSVTTQGDPAFIQAWDQIVEVPGMGAIRYDLAWSGGYYVLVDAESLGLMVDSRHMEGMLAAANAIIRAIQRDFGYRHPVLDDVGPPRFLHFMGPLYRQSDGSMNSASATYGHPGVIWHCPTGTGTSARLARMSGRGEIAAGVTLQTISPYGAAFNGVIVGHTKVGESAAINSTITARPHAVAYLDLTVDLDADMVRDFGLDEVLAPSVSQMSRG